MNLQIKIIRLLVFMLFFIDLPFLTRAHDALPVLPAPTRSIEGENQTLELLHLHKQYRKTVSADQAQMLPQLISAAQARLTLLSGLMESNPGEVLKLSLPAVFRRSFPSEVQPYVEQHVEIEGILEVLHADMLNGKSKFWYALQTASGQFALHFASNPPQLLSGSRVKVKGVRIQQDIALGSGDTNAPSQGLDVLEKAPAPNAIGQQEVAVLLINFSDNTSQPWTTSQAQGYIFNGAGSVNGYFQEASYGKTSLAGDVYGWYTLPISSSTCDNYFLLQAIPTYATSAAQAAGVDLSKYQYIMFAFPYDSACGFAGMAYIGGFGNPNYTWINGTLDKMWAPAHELGHNFGLMHAHLMDCNPTVFNDPIGTGCDDGSYPLPGTWYGFPYNVYTEYGDHFDIMGNFPSHNLGGHFNASQKERLGWLNSGSSPSMTTVTKSGTYTIDAYEPTGTSPKALKIFEYKDSWTRNLYYYYVESRQAIGYDSFLANNSEITNGVILHWSSPTFLNSSSALNMTPTDNTYDSIALEVGQSYTDNYAGITITPTAVSSSNATVNASLFTPQCVHENPSITIRSVETAWVPPGGSATFPVTIYNMDNSSCAPSTFQLASTVPIEWNATFTKPGLVVPPQGSSTTTLTIANPANTAEGFYTFSLNASNAGAPTYQTTYASTDPYFGIFVAPSLTVKICTSLPGYPCTDSPSYPVGQEIGLVPSIDLTLTFDSTITITDPDGLTVYSFSCSDCLNAWYTIPLTATPGTYTVTDDMVSIEGLAGTGTTTFTVTGLTVNATTDQVSYTPGGSGKATATVTNNGAPVSGASVHFTIAGPSNFSLDLGSVNTDTTGTALSNFTIPSNAIGGAYTLTAIATSSISGGGTANFTVTTPGMNVTATTDQSSYLAGEPGIATASVIANGLPATNATVAFTITGPKNFSRTGSVTTNSNGIASLRFILPPKAQSGVYSVAATATYNGTSKTGSTTFTVSAGTLSVKVTTDKSRYSIGQSGSTTAHVTLSGVAQTFVDVTLSIYYPDGSKLTYASELYTDTYGNAAFSFTIPPSAPTGTYTVTANVSNFQGTLHAAGFTHFTVISKKTLSVDLSTDKASYFAGQSGTATAIVTANGTPVSGANVAFTIVAPDGSALTSGNATTNSSGVATLPFALPSNASNGTYAVSVTASYNKLSTTTSTTFTVAAPTLNVSVSTNQSSYGQGQSGTATAIVTANGSPASGATVAFTITAPYGTTFTTGNTTTDTSGNASFPFAIPSNTETGTYTVTAAASYLGGSGSNSTTFTVGPPSVIVSVWTDQSSYSAGQSGIATANVQINGSPANGLHVGFSFFDPAGSFLFYGSATTDSTGNAVLPFTIPSNAQTGTYALWAYTDSGKFGETTFTVK